MKTISTNLGKNISTKNSCLSPNQKALLQLLKICGVEENQLVGTMLLLKDSVPEQEEMILFLADNKPTPEQIDDKLISIVERRQTER